MKQKLSITMDEGTVILIDGLIQNGVFRNRSHAVEYSVKRLAEKKNE